MAWVVSVALCSLALGYVGARAAYALDVAVGLGGHVVPGYLAPIRLSFIDPPGDVACLRVLQNVRNAWGGEARMSFEFPMVLSDAGDCEEVIPLYDVEQPIRVELLAASGMVLAEQEVGLRPEEKDAPFPVGVGALSAPFADRAVLVSPAELPRTWSAYAAVESVWIGRTRDGLDADRWDALACWVLSGGTVVVFTGGDFFLLDAPRLRDLLPIANPVLMKREGGTRVLAGDLRDDAAVLLSKEGLPWLIAGRYGGGSVLLVTTDALSLDFEESAELLRRIPPARTLSLVAATSDLLDRQPVDHPDTWAATLLVGLVVIALSLLVARREWRPSMGLALLGVFGLLTLSSYLYTAPRVVNDVYRTETRVSVYGSLGISVSCSALFSSSPRSAEVEVRLDGVPAEILPRRFGSGSYDLSYVDGTAQMKLAPGDRRLLTALGTASTVLQARLTGDAEVHLASRLPRRIPDALLLVDGEAFPLPAIEPRDVTLHLGEPLPSGTYRLGVEGGPIERLLAAAAHTFPLDQGAWLVAGEVTEMRRTGDGARTTVRQVSLYVVEVGRD
jgi:hypothetical protein